MVFNRYETAELPPPHLSEEIIPKELCLSAIERWNFLDECRVLNRMQLWHQS
jgi:hypothetical protein